MKFACFRDTDAPPTRRPLPPAASIRRAAWSPSGFVKTLPQLGSASGCVRRRHSRASSIAAADPGSVPGAQEDGGAGHDRVRRPARTAGTRTRRPPRRTRLGTSLEQPERHRRAPARRPSVPRALPRSSEPRPRASRGSRRRTPTRPGRGEGRRPRAPAAASRHRRSAARRRAPPTGTHVRDAARARGTPRRTPGRSTPSRSPRTGCRSATTASPAAARSCVGLRLQVERSRSPRSGTS